MIKRLPVGAALVAALAAGSVSHAASRPLSAQMRLARDFQESRVFARHQTAVRPRDVAEVQGRKPTRQDAGLLALDPSVFAPATVQTQFTGIQSNSQADNDAFRLDHSTTYEALGRVSGYYARADWQPAGSADTAIFRYQGSIFSSAATAHNAWQDGVTHTQSLSGIAPTDCTAQVQTTCSYGGYAADNNTAVVYFAVQYNQCLVETSVQITQALFTAQQTAIGQTLGAITASGVAAAQAACGTSTAPKPNTTPTPSSVQFGIVGLGVHKKQKVADPKSHSLKTIKVGKTAYLYIYYEVQSAPASAQVATTFTLTRGGTVVATKSFPHALLAPAPNAFYESAGLKMHTPGAYTFSGRVTLQDKVAEASMTFKVVK